MVMSSKYDYGPQCMQYLLTLDGYRDCSPMYHCQQSNVVNLVKTAGDANARDERWEVSVTFTPNHRKQPAVNNVVTYYITM